MSCGIGRRHSLDLALLWFWQRPASRGPIRPLAWEPPYAAGVALEKTKKTKKKGRKEKNVILMKLEIFDFFAHGCIQGTSEVICCITARLCLQETHLRYLIFYCNIFLWFTHSSSLFQHWFHLHFFPGKTKTNKPNKSKNKTFTPLCQG